MKKPLCIAGEEINYVYKALEVFVSGCTRNCPGCQNPELHEFGKGTPYKKWLKTFVKQKDRYLSLVNKIWIVGGDLLCQDLELAEDFIAHLDNLIPLSVQIVLWTGEESLVNVPNEIFQHVDGVKLGSFVKRTKSYEALYFEEDGSSTTVKLAGNNQYFVFPDFSPRLESREN